MLVSLYGQIFPTKSRFIKFLQIFLAGIQKYPSNRKF